MMIAGNLALKVGVVGYCPPTVFDEDEARRMIVDAYDRLKREHPNNIFHIVSGLTDVGVLKLAYEEADKRRWFTVGIACEKAKEHPLHDCDRQIIVGENWGDESDYFLRSIDMIIRIGGGKQSKAETEAVKARGGKAYEYDLPALSS